MCVRTETPLSLVMNTRIGMFLPVGVSLCVCVFVCVCGWGGGELVFDSTAATHNSPNGDLDLGLCHPELPESDTIL